MIVGVLAAPPSGAQQHLTRQWNASQGYVFVPCPCERAGHPCACASWTVQFLRPDGSVWGATSGASRAQVIQDRDALQALERQFRQRFPDADRAAGINFTRATSPFCNHDSAACAPLPAEFGEEITSEEKDLRQETARTVAQARRRLLQDWSALIRRGTGGKTANPQETAQSANRAEQIRAALITSGTLEALLADGATPHLKQIHRERADLDTLLDRITAQNPNAAPNVQTPNALTPNAGPKGPNARRAAQLADDKGLALYRKDRYAEATAAFLQACRLDSTNAVAQSHLALLLEKQQKYAAEESAFRELVKRTPGRATPYYWLGKALYNQGRAAEAETAFRKAIALSPKKWVYHYYLAASLRAQGQKLPAKKEEAARELKEADRLRRAQPIETP